MGAYELAAFPLVVDEPDPDPNPPVDDFIPGSGGAAVGGRGADIVGGFGAELRDDSGSDVYEESWFAAM